jgi:long-chain acyl-CoA synthetase
MQKNAANELYLQTEQLSTQSVLTSANRIKLYLQRRINATTMILAKREKTAISHGNTKISYSQLHGSIQKFAQLHPLKKGDRAVIFAENRPGWIYSLYSVWSQGATAVTIDYLLPSTDVAYILNDSQPKVAYISLLTKQTVEKAIAESNLSIELIVIDEHEALDELPNQWIDINPNIEDTAVIIYTSGTTGSPKGVMLSYQNLLVNLQAVCIDIPILTEEQTILILLPLHHILPLLGTVIAPFYMGGSTAISPSMASEDVIKTLQNDKVTVIIGVPRLYTAIRKGIMDKINQSAIAKILFRLAKSIDNQSFSKKIFKAVHTKFGGHIAFMVSGGAALDKNVASDFHTLGFEILEGYGMTEAAPMITFTRPGKLKLGSPGQTVPFAEVKIIDGEIATKGPNVMQGYWGKPEDTALVLKDGWLFTGDLGSIDEDGYLYITGRKKEIIVLSNGKNIDPVEVERKLSELTTVFSEMAVIQNGDQLHAIVFPNAIEVEKQGIVDMADYLRKDLFHTYNRIAPPYRKILNFTIVDQELPKTRLGKLKRFQLHELITEKKQPSNDKTIQEPQSEAFKIISSYISTEKGVRVTANDHIEFDLGFDSLDKVGFQVFVKNTFGIELPPEQMVTFDNMGTLVDHIEKNREKMSVEKVNWTEIIREKVQFKLPHTWFTTQLFTKLSKWFFKVYFRYKGQGLENLPEGPCIIAPNHQSFFDGLLVTGLLRSKQIGVTYFYAKEKHVKGWFLKSFAKRNNVIIMDLNKDLKQSIQKMAEVLRNRKNLVIFPEGTRSANGTLGDFKKTFAILSRELNIPIVPVSIRGAVDALPKGSIFPKPFKRICVDYLQPIYPENRSYEKIAELVKEQIQQHQQQHCIK